MSTELTLDDVVCPRCITAMVHVPVDVAPTFSTWECTTCAYLVDQYTLANGATPCVRNFLDGTYADEQLGLWEGVTLVEWSQMIVSLSRQDLSPQDLSPQDLSCQETTK